MGWTGCGSRRQGDGGPEVRMVEDPAAPEEELEPYFAVPVDSEHKATTLPICTAAQPHMRAFHLAWISFFTCFVSTFAAPPLLPIIRDNLDLTSTDVSNSGIASVSGTILARVIMGTVCDLVGPRYGCASLMLLTAPAVFSMATVSSATGFILCRFFIGFSLASFVTCQFWVSSMFSSRIAGVANGTAAGWGNLGGGATQLLMPLIFTVITNGFHSTAFTAWRLAFFVPGMLHIICAFAVLLLGQDLPDGNYRVLKKRGVKHPDKFSKILKTAATNYRMWILALTYGFSFGLELTIDNVLAEYYYDHFDLNLSRAGIIASVFGLMNIFTRPCGGILSDVISQTFGMRGRLWILWLLQSGGGTLCIVLGNVTTLATSVSVVVIFSIFVQAACGATFGIVPFVSRRALGVVSGVVGAGGNIGAVLTQILLHQAHSTNQGFVHIGIMTICCTLPLWLVHFPPWGGMITCPSPVTEADYYGSEWTESEKATGMHLPSLEFAANSCSSGAVGFLLRKAFQHMVAIDVQDPLLARPSTKIVQTKLSIASRYSLCPHFNFTSTTQSKTSRTEKETDQLWREGDILFGQEHAGFQQQAFQRLQNMACTSWSVTKPSQYPTWTAKIHKPEPCEKKSMDFTLKRPQPLKRSHTKIASCNQLCDFVNVGTASEGEQSIVIRILRCIL